MTASPRHHTAVLDFWRNAELLSPPAIPKVNARDRFEPVFAVSNTAEPLPWQPGHPIGQRFPGSGRKWRYTWYGGTYELERVRDILDAALRRPALAYQEPIRGESCLFAVSFTDDGRPLFDTFVVSSCAWALGQLSKGPRRMPNPDEFEAAAETMRRDFELAFAVEHDDARGQQILSWGFAAGRPMTGTDLGTFTQQVARKLGVGGVLTTNESRIRSFGVSSAKHLSPDDQDFLNSFFLKDLGKVSRELGQGRAGSGLLAYLMPENQLPISERVDVRQNLQAIFDQFSPALFPAGCWPTKDHHPLVLSQQFAINTATAGLQQGGLSSVNGPPGTGKTTLLRDLVAAVVVQRADRLAKLTTPSQAFSGHQGYRAGKYTRRANTFRDDLLGFEIVVASSNNGAVENITLEIPKKDAVDPSWLKEVDYFAQLAGEVIGQEAWALLAARLGNKQNRSDFISKFWYGPKVDDPASFGGFKKYLEGQETQVIDWPRAVRRYQKAVKAEQELRTSRVSAFNLRTQLANAQASLQGFPDELDALDTRLALLDSRISHLSLGAQGAATTVSDLEARRAHHQTLRPGVWANLRSFGQEGRTWQAADSQHELDIAEGAKALEKARAAHQSAQQLKITLEHERSSFQQRLGLLQAEVQRLTLKLQGARVELGGHFADPADWAQDDAAQEHTSPWADPVWNKARRKLFLEALNLHRAFIQANAKALRQNLMVAIDLLGGDLPSTASDEVARTAWTSLCLVVPVISTTFASFDRLFARMGKESLGWLLIDEAGQAMPQVAAGAIWRAKRTLVVGDPMQLEPVVSLPQSVQEALRAHHGVTEDFAPRSTSVQELADRTTRFGTALPHQDGSALWVGAPLRVHRRCDEPMFSISNRVAYGGMMVFGTSTKPSLSLPASGWWDVQGPSDSHFIPAEGDALRELLTELRQRGQPMDQVYLISPFRSVVRELREIGKTFGASLAGTVHTVQGKEADIVILVLGGQPSNVGAKAWAASTPNLLNVAVSRARRRLYVVGNRQTWSSHPYFADLSRLLAPFAK